MKFSIKEKRSIDRTIYRNFPFKTAIFYGDGETMEEGLSNLEKEIEGFPSGSVGNVIDREVTVDGIKSDEMSDPNVSLYDYI